MEYFEIPEVKYFSEELRKLLPTDRAHAGVFNDILEKLINNDVYLNDKSQDLLESRFKVIEELLSSAPPTDYARNTLSVFESNKGSYDGSSNNKSTVLTLLGDDPTSAIQIVINRNYSTVRYYQQEKWNTTYILFRDIVYDFYKTKITLLPGFTANTDQCNFIRSDNLVTFKLDITGTVPANQWTVIGNCASPYCNAINTVICISEQHFGRLKITTAGEISVFFPVSVNKFTSNSNWNYY